jgi:predicted nucleotidyltransferase
MPSVCRLDIRRGPELYAELDQKLSDLACLLRQRYHIHRILIFGSYGRRDLHEGSDIDLVIIGDFPLRFHERPSLVRDLTDLPIEPLCYTPAEFEELFAADNPFIMEILSEAVDL